MAAKKTPAKAGRSSNGTKRSASKALKEEQLVTPKNRSTRKPNAAFTHHLPTEEQRKNNGRVRGRSLIVWGRPRMAEKFLLNLQYECHRAKIDLPWNAIAHRLHPGSSGAAVTQYLTRMRKDLLAEGHLVPPPAQAKGPIDASIRGYIREKESDDKATPRPVSFAEKLEDRRFAFADAHDDTSHATPASTSGGFGQDDEDEKDPFTDSPCTARQLFRTPNSNRRSFIDPSPSFGDDEDTPVGNGHLPRGFFSGQRVGQDMHFNPMTPEAWRSINTFGNSEPQTPVGMGPPVTPTRPRLGQNNTPLGYGLPYYGSMPYISPDHGEHYLQPAMPRYGLNMPRSTYHHDIWEPLPMMNTNNPFDPGMQYQQQFGTPRSSPLEPAVEDQTQPGEAETAETDVDSLIDFDGDAQDASEAS